LRILAVSFRYPPYVRGGYELLTRDAVEGLRARGHRVTVLCARGARLCEEGELLPWLAPELDGSADALQRALTASDMERFRLHFFRLANWRASARAIERVRPEVMLFFNLALVSLAPILAARHAGLPTLGYVADRWPLNHWLADWAADPRAARAKPRRLAFAQDYWRAFRELTALGPLAVCSRALAGELEQAGLPAADLEVLPLGLGGDAEERAQRRAQTARKAQEPLRVVCLSALWRGKGQDTLLEAVAGARARGACLELVLAGGGEPGFQRQLQARAERADLAGCVRFAGALERSAVFEELARGHVLAMPSTWSEPFGLATLEGLAFGLAVVGSDAGATREIVEHGRTGLIARAGDARAWTDALLTLERDEAQRLALGRAGRERVGQAFTSRAFLDRLEPALARALRAGAR
jgi:glycosyltransferase involved in cell wall biosynthesis